MRRCSVGSDRGKVRGGERETQKAQHVPLLRVHTPFTAVICWKHGVIEQSYEDK